MNKHTKTLLWIAGFGAIAYYYYHKNKAAKKATAVVPSTSAAQFTGDLDVAQYQNAVGKKHK